MLFRTVCFHFNSDPEKGSTRRKKKRETNSTWHRFVSDVTKHVFVNGEGLQTLILGIFTTKMLHCNSLNRKSAFMFSGLLQKDHLKKVDVDVRGKRFANKIIVTLVT